MDNEIKRLDMERDSQSCDSNPIVNLDRDPSSGDPKRAMKGSLSPSLSVRLIATTNPRFL